MLKSFAYLRVSGKAQVAGDGFTRQLAAIQEYAKAHDIRIAQTFRDEGVSGTTELENRPALGALIEALHSNGTKLVLIERLDRLARDLMVQESIIHDLQRNGFQIVSVAEPDLCSNDPSRKLMRQIMGAFSEYEKAMLVQKLRGARNRKRAKEGRCEGRKPFGHYPGEAKALERLRELKQAGLGVDRIAAALNSEGIPARSGKWYGMSVSRILKAAR